MVRNNSFVLAPGVVVEDLGADSAVYIPGVSEVLTLSGDAATTFRDIREGAAVNPEDPVVVNLEQLGVIRSQATISRRGVITAGGVGLAAGIAVLVTPSVAAASSDGPQNLTGGFAVDYVALSATGTNIEQITLGISRDGSRELVDLGLSQGNPGVITLANGTVINVTFNEGDKSFRSGATNIDDADFTDRTHILEFTIGAQSFRVEFSQRVD